jgi:hypothetical protein
MTESIKNDEIIQIGIVVKDINASTSAWAKFLNQQVPQIFLTDGFDKTQAEYMSKPCYGRIYQSFFRLKNVEIELIQPIDEKPSVWLDFLNAKGEGIHHIAFKVTDMASNINTYQKEGHPLIQKGEFPGGRYAYLDAMSSMRVILEFLEYDK